MAISSYYFRKSHKQWHENKKDYSLQGRCLSNKNKLNIILDRTENTDNTVNHNFESAFSGMNFKNNNLTSKSLRKYLKCYSQLSSYQNGYSSSNLLGLKKGQIKTEISN